jgi:thioredoxin reductase
MAVDMATDAPVEDGADAVGTAVGAGPDAAGQRAQGSYDVVVIGGGAAGLSAALTLGRSRRSVLVVDAGDPRNAPAGHVHNYLAREGTPPAELTAIARAEVATYGVQLVTTTVASAHPAQDGLGSARFEVVLEDGRTVAARRLVVATGLVDELPDVPGVRERWGRDVLHCPYCHGWEVRDQTIGVLATGPGSFHQAVLFSQLSADVTVFLHTAPDPTAEQWEQLAARGVGVVDGEVTALEVTGDRLSGLRLTTGEVFARQAVVVAPRFTARTGALSGLGLEATELRMGETVLGTRVAAESNGATSVPGVYVAGNVTDLYAQVIGAAAAGSTTGAAVNADLLTEDTTRAVAAQRARSSRQSPPAEAFSAAMEAEVCERVLGARRHGLATHP